MISQYYNFINSNVIKQSSSINDYNKISRPIRSQMEKKVSLDDFTTLSLIGRGNYAKVILVYALKILKKRKLQQRRYQKQHAFLEKQIMIDSVHPFIIKCSHTFQNDKRLFFVLEYCCGGELLGLLKRKMRFNQEMAKFYSGQILLALEYLHSQEILYLDLKPQNILLDQHGYIRLTDFGLSRKMGSQETMIVGTPQYLAPEILEKTALTAATDWWEFGTIIYEMVTGLPPFYQEEQPKAKLLARIKNQNPKYPSHISSSLKSLLQGLLHKNPSERLGNNVDDIKKHSWFSNVSWQKLLQKSIKAPFAPNLKSEEDVSCFDSEFTECQQQFSPQMYTMNSEGSNKSFKGFSYTRSKGSCSPPEASSPLGSFDMEMIEIEYN